MRFLTIITLISLTGALPDFDAAIPFFELSDAKIGGEYRHRANRQQKTSTTVLPTTRSPPLFGRISDPLARSEGKTGGNMKKIKIMKEKTRTPEKAQGIHIHSLPKGTMALQVNSNEESISEIRKRFNVSLKNGDSILPSSDNTRATEWPPMRSTLAPNGGEFNKHTFLLLSDWLNSEKEKRDLRRDDDFIEQKRVPMIRALARARPIVRIDDIADPPFPLHFTPSTTPFPHLTTHRIVKKHKKRMRKPFSANFADNLVFSTMSFTPMEEKKEEKRHNAPTIIPPPDDVETTEFVEDLADKIESEESEVVNKRREHRKRNYGVNPLMYKVVDGILYDRAGQAVRRVEIPLRDEGHQKNSKGLRTDGEIGHDDISIYSASHTHSTTQSPSFDLDVSPLSLDPLPLPTASLISFPQSTTRFHWDSSLSTTPFPSSDGMNPPFPFINCYMNVDGFMCCNRLLESTLRAAFDSLPCRGIRSGCSVQHIVKRVRSEVESKFSSDFEIVASLGDFAMHAHFIGDLTCKIEKEGRFIAAYAIAAKKSPSSSLPSPITEYMMLPRDRSIATPKELVVKKKKRKKIIENQSVSSSIPQPAMRFTGGIQTATPRMSIESLQASILTTIPTISIDLDSSHQLDAPSININKPDESFHRVIPLHERSRGKNDISFH